MAQLEALEERRAIQVRHERFNAALITATLINGHRTEADQPTVSPFDFLAGYNDEEAAEQEERQKLRRSVKNAITLAFVQMRTLSPEAIQVERAKMVTNMTANGIEDADELIREVFPDL